MSLIGPLSKQDCERVRKAKEEDWSEERVEEDEDTVPTASNSSPGSEEVEGEGVQSALASEKEDVPRSACGVRMDTAGSSKDADQQEQRTQGPPSSLAP